MRHRVIGHVSEERVVGISGEDVPPELPDFVEGRDDLSHHHLAPRHHTTNGIH